MASNSSAWILALAVAVAPALTASVSSAEPTATQKETARGLMQSGDEKFAAGDYGAALKAYQAAYELVQVPTTALAVARAHAKLGHLVEALDLAGIARRHPKEAAEPEALTEARQAAIELENDLVARVPQVTVVVTGPAPSTPIELTVDGTSVAPAAGQAVRVNPGERIIGVSAPGYFEATKAVTVAEAARVSVDIVLERDPDYVPPSEPSGDATDTDPSGEGGARKQPPPEPGMDWSPYMYTGFAVGGAGILVGAITGALALSKSASLEDECGGTLCPIDREGDVDTIDALANVSNVAFVVGVLGVGLGVVSLVLDQTSSEADTAVRLQLGPGFVGVGGSF